LETPQYRPMTAIRPVRAARRAAAPGPRREAIGRPERSRGARPLPPQRWSARRKAEIVLRLLKGESIDALSHETQQTAARLTECRDAFLVGAESPLQGRPEEDE